MKTATTIQFIYTILLSFENTGIGLQTVILPKDVLNPIKETSTCPNKFSNILQENSHIYVDKTLLLEVIFDPQFYGTNIIKTMPKRFGKSLNLQMIQKFCEIEMYDDATPVTKDPDNINDTPNYDLFAKKYVFGNLKIAEKKEFIQEHLGKHPVAYFDFIHCLELKENIKLQDVVKCCRTVVHEAFLFHRYLLNSDKLEEEEQRIAKSWLDEDFMKKEKSDVFHGVHQLIRVLYWQFQKDVIVLIDEYDLVIHHILSSELPKEEAEGIFEFYTEMFVLALKPETMVRVALFTGILHVSDLGLNTVLPKVKKCCFAQNDKFLRYYGFTTAEVEELFKRPGNSFPGLKLDAVKSYYDGYNAFGETIYSPYSIIKCLTKKVIKPYWSECGSIGYVWPALRLFRLRVIVLDLFDKKNVDIQILKKIIIYDIITLQQCMHYNENGYGETHEINIFLNFILHAGYLTVNSRNETHYNVKIPNEEVRFDIEVLLNQYKEGTIEEKEAELQIGISRWLKSIDFFNFEVNMEKITYGIDDLCKLILPEYLSYKETNLNNIIRMICFTTSLHYYIEIGVDNGTARSGYLDILITNIPGMLVAIETTYQDGDSKKRTSQQALEEIEEIYLNGLINSEHQEYKKSHPYKILMLGICVTRVKEKTIIIPRLDISAKMVNIANSKIIEESKSDNFVGRDT